ncbi:MAG TPA: type II toxin-antitoxin system RelE/ParE family toxin [Povalibacter sp.]|nr:type II toxin-antitoxin system RelE/ParE family toxin [Povalibacter sp.]
MKVEFFPAAEQELTEATEQYERQFPGLGNDFLLELERLATLLLELPSLGEKLDSIHRRLPMQRFPYALIYRRDADAILIVAIAHRRRRPDYWAPRVQDR